MSENIVSIPDIDSTIASVVAKMKANGDLRQKLIDKVFKDAKEVEFDTKNAKLLEAQLGIITTVDTLMKSDVNDALNLAKLTLSNKTADDSAKYAQQSLAVLKEIQLKQAPPEKPVSMEELDAGIDDLIDEIDTKEISPDEIKE